MTPGTCRREPSSPSSPMKALSATAVAGSTPSATIVPTAIGRSRPAPPLRTPDGARLTVTRRRGHDRPLERRAARTRSRDSRTAASGRPTTVNPGSPSDTCTSTATGRPTQPTTVAEAMTAILATTASPRGRRRRRGAPGRRLEGQPEDSVTGADTSRRRRWTRTGGPLGRVGRHGAGAGATTTAAGGRRSGPRRVSLRIRWGAGPRRSPRRGRAWRRRPSARRPASRPRRSGRRPRRARLPWRSARWRCPGAP